MKRFMYMFIIVTIGILALFYFGNDRASASLFTNKSISKRVDDFILHIYVEDGEEGFQVFRSIEYIGDDPIEINHQTPLISVSFQQKNHDFTGSNVSKTLNHGMSYYPQDELVLAKPKKGKYPIYVCARFNIKGERLIIEHEEMLEFK